MQVRKFSPYKLLRAREALGLTRWRSVAAMRQAGYPLTEGTLQNHERGWRKVPATALPYFAAIYKCGVLDFFGAPYTPRRREKPTEEA